MDEVHKRLGNYIERRLSSLQGMPKYILEIALRLPMMFFIHHYLLLAPYSDYWILELVLLPIRWLGGFYMIGSLQMEKVNMMRAYSALTLDMLVAWKFDRSFWSIQKVMTECGNESCPNLVDIDGFWWTMGDIILIQSCYMIYLKFRYNHVFYSVRVIHVIWHVVLCFILLMFNMVSVLYYVYKLWFVVAVLGQMMYNLYDDKGVKIAVDSLGLGTPSPLLPHRWIMRDLNSCFAVMYFFICFIIEVTCEGWQIITVQSCFTFVGKWTTTVLVLLSLAAFFGKCSNFILAIGGSVFLGHMGFREALDAYVGRHADIGMVMISLNAGILSSSQFERTEKMPVVILLIMFVVICQLWDMTEKRLLFLMNSGERLLQFAVLRAILFMAVIVVGPTYFAFYMASSYGIDVWSLFNITGLVLILSRTAVAIVECGLLAVSSFMEDGVERLSDFIYYTRVCKSILTIICTILLTYYRFTSPYFDGPILFRLPIIAIDCLFITITITLKEWRSYQQRQQLMKKLDIFPNATEEELTAFDDVCAVCYDTLNDGKRLMCGHIFHRKCLAKWFQIKTTCPMCGTLVHVDDE